MVKHYGELKEKGSLRNLSSFIKVKNDDSGISDNKKKKEERKSNDILYPSWTHCPKNFRMTALFCYPDIC